MLIVEEVCGYYFEYFLYPYKPEFYSVALCATNLSKSKLVSILCSRNTKTNVENTTRISKYGFYLTS